MSDDLNAADSRERNRNLMVLGAIVGVVYGLAVRLAPHVFPHVFDTYTTFVMTAGFTCFLPFAMGFTAVLLAEIGNRQRIWAWFYLPLVPLVGTLLGVWLLLLEGLPCIIMFIPLGMVLSVLGGVAGGLAGRSLHSRWSRSSSLQAKLELLLHREWRERPARPPATPPSTESTIPKGMNMMMQGSPSSSSSHTPSRVPTSGTKGR